MAKSALAVAVLVLAAAGCAHASAGSRTAVEPSASIREAMQPMAGHWQGVVWETGGSFYQGHTPLDLRIDDDGTWRGKVGKSDASGTARLDRHGNLVLSGTTKTATGEEDPVNYTLRGDSTRRWGQVVGNFQGREEHASVSLRKTA